MKEQWQELKETIIELRDNDGTGTQQEVCKFLVNYMGVLEKQIQEPCDDAISRDAVLSIIDGWYEQNRETENIEDLIILITYMDSVTQKSGKCKNCKYFEYDSVAKVDGIPLIVAHEICNKWGGGCKTKEDGYCYLFEPQESEDKE